MTLLKDSLPWSVECASLVDKGGEHFADVVGYAGIKDDKARAALIVRAVNAHAALVSALEAMCEEQRHPSPAYEVAQKLLSSLD